MMLRRIVYLGSVAVLVAAALIVPLPLLVVEPGLAASVTGQGGGPSFITIEGGTDELEGRYLLTAVEVSPQSTVRTIAALLDDVEEVTLPRTVVPEGIEPQEFAELQRQLFRESIRVAGAVGAREAGLDVTISGDGARVEGILPGAPADGVLRQGDVVVGVDGTEIGLASELASELEGRSAGTEVTLRFRRGEQVLERTLRLAPVQSLSAGIGILVSTVDRRIDLPVRIEAADEVSVGGPSAGLVFALAVYDRLVEEDLVTGGRAVAGTGSIDLQGRVGPIGGIAAKVATARRADAEVFLAPSEQAEAARAAAGGDLEVVGVASLREAIDALRQRGG